MNNTLELEDWNLDADLRAVDRLLKSLGKKLRLDEVPFGSTATAIPQTHPLLRNELPIHSAAATYSEPKNRQPEVRGTSNFLPWMIICGSLVALACGAVLLGWAQWGGRSDLWSLGLPFALAGQAGLIVGLMLQISGLSFNHRVAQATLQQLDERFARQTAPQALPPPSPHFAPTGLSQHEVNRQLESLATRLGS